MRRKIKSLKQFKESTRKTGYINRMTGKNTIETYHLYYGFDKSIDLGCTNIKDAYGLYKRNFLYFDKYITKGGFLDN